MGPRPLATRLREYAIRSKQLKIDDTNRHGYLRADFEDAFSRYLAKIEPRNATDATTQSYQGSTAQSDPLRKVAGSLSELAANHNKHREVAPVADRIAYSACEWRKESDRDCPDGRVSLFSAGIDESIEREI